MELTNNTEEIDSNIFSCNYLSNFMFNLNQHLLDFINSIQIEILDPYELFVNNFIETNNHLIIRSTEVLFLLKF